MRTSLFLAAGLTLAWCPVATAYSPLIETTRAKLPEYPAVSVSIKGEKEGELELLIKLSPGKAEPEAAIDETELDRAAQLDFNEKHRSARAFRHLNAIRLLVPEPPVLGAKEPRKALTLLGFPAELLKGESPYKETAELFILLAKPPVDALSGEKRTTLSRAALKGAVLHFDCRQDGHLGPTYQVQLMEYLDKAGKEYLEQKQAKDPGSSISK